MQEKQFIQKGVRKVRLDEYLEKELEGSGYSHCDIVRTPTSTKVVVYAQRPGLIIGRGGSRIKELTSSLEEDFDFENPQIEVNEIENGDASAKIVAQSMADWLEKGGSAKRVGYTYLRRMKEAGVIGAEIEITGKLSGNRGRTEKFSYGYVKRCGNTARSNVDSAYTLARTKPGAIGVKVRIMKDLPDFMHRNVDVEDEILHETVGHDEETPESEQIRRVLAEAENMTAAGISQAAEEVGVDTDEISVDTIRNAFEEMDEELEDVEIEDEEESEKEDESDEEAEETEEEQESDDSADEADSNTSIDYEEIVSGTIGDAKDQLQEVSNPDWEAALEAEKDDKNRVTFTDWLETRVSEDG